MDKQTLHIFKQHVSELLNKYVKFIGENSSNGYFEAGYDCGRVDSYKDVLKMLDYVEESMFYV